MNCWSFSYGDLLERNARLSGRLLAPWCQDEWVRTRICALAYRPWQVVWQPWAFRRAIALGHPLGATGTPCEAAGATFGDLEQAVEGFEEAVGLSDLCPCDDIL